MTFNPIGTNVIFNACVPGGGSFLPPSKKIKFSLKKPHFPLEYHNFACFKFYFEVHYLYLA